MSQDWLKRLLGNGARVDLTIEEALAMVREKTEALSLLEQLLHDRHAEVERLGNEERQFLSKLAALSEERSEMERRLEESLVATRVAETQLLSERIAVRAARRSADELAGALDESDRKLACATERVALLERQQAQQAAALHYERRRWRSLIGVFWQALEQALGQAAGLPLNRALLRNDALRDTGELAHADTAAAAAPLLAQALRTRALGGGASVREHGDGLQIRIEPAEPQLPEDAVPTWVGLLATHVLGGLLGRRLVLAGSERVGTSLWVQVRYRAEPLAAHAQAGGQSPEPPEQSPEAPAGTEKPPTAPRPG